jgi:hypothetical protein
MNDVYFTKCNKILTTCPLLARAKVQKEYIGHDKNVLMFTAPIIDG